MKSHVVIVEVDEHQHSMYDVSCERARELHISDAIGRPTYFIRYNPDSYHVNGTVVKVKTTIRETRLISVLREFLLKDVHELTKNGVETVFLYYDDK